MHKDKIKISAFYTKILGINGIGQIAQNCSEKFGEVAKRKNPGVAIVHARLTGVSIYQL